MGGAKMPPPLAPQSRIVESEKLFQSESLRPICVFGRHRSAALPQEFPGVVVGDDVHFLSHDSSYLIANPPRDPSILPRLNSALAFLT